MAAAPSGRAGIFWRSGASDEEQPLVFIPGGGEAKTPFNLGRGSIGVGNRRGTRTRKSNNKKETTLKKEDRRRDYSESECSGVYHQDEMSATPVQSISQDSGGLHHSTKVFPEPTRAKGLISLKDLCPDDKRRIANLIEELARVSEEKDVSVQRLKDEHQNFEQKIQQLEEHNVMIAQERESLQHQYKECQELLGLYQQYLSLQQVKLNQSIAQLSQDPAISQVLSREEPVSSASSHRSNGLALDGSYLGFATSGPNRVRDRRGGEERAPTDDKPASRSSVELSPENAPMTRQKCEARGPHPEFHHSCHHCRCQGGCYGTQQLRCDERAHRRSGLCDELDQHGCERLHVGRNTSPEAKEALMMPILGHKDWEEKRHQLLLQKMQLEVERERLQVRLAEQEERLSRQNQQLQQSHLHSNRDQQADFSGSYSANGGLHMEASIQQQLPTRNKPDEHSVPADRETHSLVEKHSQTEPALVEHEEALKRSRKDMDTSTAKSSLNLSRATTASVIQEPPQTSSRMEVSVAELLDIMSPDSAPKPTRGQPKMPHQPVSKTPRLGGRALPTPTWSHHRQDQEESQILEDIFFIC